MTPKLLFVNGAVGLASTLAAWTTMWLVMTEPADLAGDIASGRYTAVALAVVAQLGAWAHLILRFL